MGARLTVPVHSAQMRNDNPTELTVFHRLADLVDDLDQNVTLGDMVVPRDFRTGYGEHGKLRGAVKVADDLNPLRPNPFHSLSAKCPA